MGVGDPAAFLRSPAVTVGDLTATGLDVVLSGVLTGAWADLEQRAVAGLALEAAAPPPENVRSGVTAFRYAKRLISASEFLAWLAERQFTTDDITRFATRELLRSQHPADDAAATEDIRQIFVEASCADILQGCARDLANAMLAAQQVATRPPGDSAPLTRWLAGTPLGPLLDHTLVGASQVPHWAAAYDIFRDGAAGPAAIAGCVAEFGADWDVVRTDTLFFSEPGQALEARMLMSEGTPPELLSGYASQLAEQSFFVEDAAPPLQTALLRAREPGTTAAWPEAGGWRAAIVRARQAADPADPGIAERARERLVQRELTKIGAGQVQFHVAL